MELGCVNAAPTPKERTKAEQETPSLKNSPMLACVVCLYCTTCVCVCHRILSVLLFDYKVRWGKGHTSRVAVAWPLATSQSRAVLSSDPVASVRPSGVKATLVNRPVWP